MSNNNIIAKAMRLLQSRSGSPQPMADGGLPTLQYRGPDGNIANAATEDELGRLYDSRGNLVGHNSKFENERYGAWDNPEDQSTLDWLGTKAYDYGQGAYNGLANLVGAVTPFGTSEQGNMALQVPPMIPAVGEAFGRLMGTPENPGTMYSLTGIPELDKPIQDDTNTAVMSMFGGNAFNPLAAVPKGAIASGAIREASSLPMDVASRMARAKELGFDVDNTAYRGLTRPFDESDTGYYQMFTSSPAEASEYAMQNPLARPNVVPAYLRKGNNLEVDAMGRNFNSVPTGGLPEPIRSRLGPVARTDEIAHAAREAGYDSATIKNVIDNATNEVVPVPPAPNAAMKAKRDAELDAILAELDDLGPIGASSAPEPAGWDGVAPHERGPVTIDAIFDPANIRSVNAAFDPSRIGENGLLLSDSGKPSLMGSAIAGSERVGSSTDLIPGTSGGITETAPIRAYHGMSGELEGGRFSPDRFGQNWADDEGGVFFSTNPREASAWAENADYLPEVGAAVVPADVSFSNPLRVDARFHSKGPSDYWYSNRDDLRLDAERGGHDGVIVDGPEGSTIAALQPGTVKSPYTGETLFSDTGKPNIMGAALATAGEQSPQVQNALSVASRYAPTDSAIPQKLYRGDYRADKMGDWRIVDPEEGGSGGIYMTDNPDVASNYATGKSYIPDDWWSMIDNATAMHNGKRKPLSSIPLTTAQKASISDSVLNFVNQDGDKPIGKHTWDSYLAQNRGNPLKAAEDLMLNGAVVDHIEFENFLRDTKAFKAPYFDDPSQPRPAVTSAYLDTKNPFDVQSATPEVLEKIKSIVGPDDETFWGLNRARETGEADTLTTVTPAFRKALLDMGYDAIKDMGGRITGGVNHGVAIAIKPGTVRSATTGETLFSDTGKPNILGSAIATAGDSPLPMDYASRMARAKELGFDTDTTWYHGTNKPISEFDRSMLPEDEPGFSFSNNRDIAQSYANLRARQEGGEPTVQEVYLNPSRFETTDRMGESYSPEVHDQLWQDFDSWNGRYGVSGTVMENMPDRTSSMSNQMANGKLGEHTAYVYDPSQIRSVNAAFNPADSDKAGLLLSDTGRPNILGSAIATAGEQPRNSLGAGAMRGGEGQPIRAYSGTMAEPFDNFKDGPWMSTNPDVAGMYAGTNMLKDPLWADKMTTGRIYPVDINPKNPFNIPNGEAINDSLVRLGVDPKVFDGSIADAARARGHDFAIYDVAAGLDGPWEHLQYQALQPNTVRSATTGETLFSDNKPSISGAALATAGETPTPQTLKPFNDSTPKSGGGVKPYRKTKKKSERE